MYNLYCVFILCVFPGTYNIHARCVLDHGDCVHSHRIRLEQLARINMFDLDHAAET